jgi:TrkA domain protein
MGPAPGQIDEDDLPGIGRRFTFGLPDGASLCVVIHHTGRRDIYLSPGRDEPSESVTLEDDTARRVGAVIAGSYFTPAAVAQVEAVIGGLLIDWVTVREGSAIADRAIADAEVRRKSRMTVAAIVRGDEQIVAPAPDEVIRVGDQLVMMGRPEDLPGFLDEFIH